MIRSRLIAPSAALLFACLATTACVETPNPTYTPNYNYNNAQAYSLDVSETLFINDNRPNALTQEFATKFGSNLDSELENWIAKRINTSGSKGTLSVIVKDANFNATPLAKRDGVEGYFTRDQAARWDGTLTVLVSVDGGADGYSSANFTVTVTANSTVPEKASDDEKSKIYHSLVNKLVTLFNQEADKQIHTNFGKYMR